MIPSNTQIQLIYKPLILNLAHWYKDVEQTGFKIFNTIANTITINYRSILNYFINEVLMLQQNLLIQR